MFELDRMQIAGIVALAQKGHICSVRLAACTNNGDYTTVSTL